MTQLIIALDGVNPAHDYACLYEIPGVTWFKVGPQTLLRNPNIIQNISRRFSKIFLDLKLVDTPDTCISILRRAEDLGISAISTYTDRVSTTCMTYKKDIKIWRVCSLTSELHNASLPQVSTNGIICPVCEISKFNVSFTPFIDIVCPGIRMTGAYSDNHLSWNVATPQAAKDARATHIVVGRPIWNAIDPVAATIEFLNVLK